MNPDQIQKANAGLRNMSALVGAKPLSLTPGFSRVVGTAKNGNGFNRFPRAIVTKPLKRLDRHPHLFTGLKPGANEKPNKSASARIAEAKDFLN